MKCCNDKHHKRDSNHNLYIGKSFRIRVKTYMVTRTLVATNLDPEGSIHSSTKNCKEESWDHCEAPSLITWYFTHHKLQPNRHLDKVLQVLSIWTHFSPRSDQENSYQRNLSHCILIASAGDKVTNEKYNIILSILKLIIKIVVDRVDSLPFRISNPFLQLVSRIPLIDSRIIVNSVGNLQNDIQDAA